MPWAKGQSGNPAGSKKGSRKQSNSVEALIKRGSKASLKLLCRVVEGLEEASIGDRVRAGTYLIDRDLGKPEAAQSAAQGMFAGATIMVDTGIKRTLEPPTINGESHAVDATPASPDKGNGR